jgi:hypothetical protein
MDGVDLVEGAVPTGQASVGRGSRCTPRAGDRAARYGPGINAKSVASTPDLAAIHFFCWAGLAVSRSRDTCAWLSLDAPHGNSARWHQPTHSKRAAVVQGYADGRTTTGNE